MFRRSLMSLSALAVLFTGACDTDVGGIDVGPTEAAGTVPGDLCEFVGAQALSTIVPNPGKNDPLMTEPPAESPSRWMNQAVCKVQTARPASGPDDTGQLIMQLFRYGGAISKSGTEWAQGAVDSSCKTIGEYARQPGAFAVPAKELEGIGDSACATVWPQRDGRVDVYLRARRGADYQYYDLIRRPGDARATPAAVIALARTTFDRL